MVDTIAVGFVVDPVAVIDVSIDVDELSFSVGPIIFPLSLILCTVWPLLDAVAIPEPSNPLSFVGGSRLEGILGSLLPLSVWIIRPGLGDSLARLIDREVA